MDVDKLMALLGYSTQTALGAALDPPCIPSTVSRWRSGIGRDHKYRIVQLAKTIGVDPDSLGLDK